jgi:hypothetical protein
MAATPSTRWISSSKTNPCPICGRTKDADCRTSSDGLQAICHKPKDYPKGEVVNGWAFTGNTKDGRAGHFKPHEDKSRDKSRPSGRKVIPLRRAPQPAPITGPITLATIQEIAPDRVEFVEGACRSQLRRWLDPEGWQTVTRSGGYRPVRYYYGGTKQWVERIQQPGSSKKEFRCWHADADSLPKAGAGPDPWPVYNEFLVPLTGRAGRWLLEVEGEKSADFAMLGGLAAITQPGHAHKVEQISDRYKALQGAGVAGVVYLADHDDEGQRRAAQAQEAAALVQLPLLVLPAAQVWPDLPKGGSIDDAPGTPAERVETLVAAIPEQDQADLPQVPQTLDELLGTAEEGKLRRPRTDKLTQALGLILPVRYNLLANRIEHNGEPIHGDYLSGLYLELAEQHQMEVAKDRAIDAAIRVARQNAFHPVQDYLTGITEQLSTEEWASIDVHCFGGHDPSGWAAKHLQRQLIGLVARALDPGCELHTCLVLQSDQQGIGKSTFWKLLGGQWFSDSLGDLRDVREDRLQLHSAWIHEWGEIDNVMGKRESETLKRFLSCSRDDVRRPYGRGTEQLLRSCGLVGTTNRRDFVKDPTGNRRFPIIKIKQVQLDWVKANRDRIWCSAVAAYRAGQPWHYSSSEGLAVSQQAMQYAAENPLRDQLEAWAEDHPDVDEVPVVRILWDLRHECPDYWERRRNQEFMRQMSLALTTLGWAVMEGRVRYLLPDQTKTDKVSLWKRAK